jgi:hypothetical protein
MRGEREGRASLWQAPVGIGITGRRDPVPCEPAALSRLVKQTPGRTSYSPAMRGRSALSCSMMPRSVLNT